MKYKFAFLILFIPFISFKSSADHFAGGEISWRCLPDGKFVFYMNIFRECANGTGGSAGSWNYSINRILDITGTTLPRDSNNQSINNITLIPDNNRWILNNNGNLDSECDSNGANYSCTGLSYGVLQGFYYKSIPLQLKGTPPPTGWKFFFQSPCCSEILENIDQSAAGFPLILRAHMFSDLANNPTDSCYDNSPYFVEQSSNVFCRGVENSAFTFAEDKNLQDSLSFHLSYPIKTPITNPLSVLYETGYSYLNPTPDTTFNINNVPFTLNNKTGESKMKVINGIGTIRYSVVIQVDSWREGKKISSVFRELPYSIIDCPTLSSGSANKKPLVYINNTALKSVTVNVFAGQSVLVPMVFTDNDLSNFLPQYVTFIPKGNQFANDFFTTSNCDLPPCAKIRSLDPVYNSSKGRYEIKRISSFGTQLRWQTDSIHLGPNYSPKAYRFYYTVFDDHCPIPGSVNGVIIVNVLPNAVGLEKVERKEIELKVYPNPNNGQFFIQSNSNHAFTVRIRNLQGQVLSTNQYKNSNQIKVDLNENAGIYLLEIENDRGERFQEKVIKF